MVKILTSICTKEVNILYLGRYEIKYYKHQNENKVHSSFDCNNI